MQKVLEVGVILSAVDRMTKVINAATNNAVSKLGNMQTKADAVARSAFAVGRDMGQIGLATAAALAYPIKAAADFESGMANVRKVVDGLQDSAALAQMGKDVRVLSRELPITQRELLELVAAGGRMGVPKAELMEYTRLVAKMGIAFDAPAAEIGEQMGKLAETFKIPINRIGQLADVINYLDDNAIAKGPDIINVMRRVAGTAQQVGLSAPRVAALASTFLTLGSTAETAATASNALIRELSIATIQPGRFQDGLASLGLQAATLQKQMTIDPQATILSVLERINKLPKSQQVQVTTQLFGKEYGDDISRLAQGMGTYRKQLELLNNPKLNGSVQREFAIRSQTANAQAQLFKNQLNELAIVVGSALLPMLNRALTAIRPVVQRFAEWAERNPDLIAKIGMVVAGISAISLAGSGIAFMVGGIAKAFSLLSGAFSFAVRAGGFLVKVFNVIRIIAAVVGGTTIAIVAGIALAAYLIYRYWGNIVAFFKNLWERVKVIFSGVWEWLKNFFTNFTLVGLIIKHWGDIKAVLSVFYDAGKNIVLAIWEGIKSLAMKPVEAIKAIVSKVRDFLPFSPAKTGPLRDLHRVRIVETIAATMRPGPMVDAMQNVTGTAFGGGPRRSSGGGYGLAGASTGGGIVLNFSPTINAGPGTDKDAIIETMRQYMPEFLRLVESAMDRKKRTKF